MPASGLDDRRTSVQSRVSFSCLLSVITTGQVCDLCDRSVLRPYHGKLTTLDASTLHRTSIASWPLVLSELRGLSKQAEELATKSVPRCDGCFRTPCCAGEARRTSQTQSIRRRRVRLSRKPQRPPHDQGATEPVYAFSYCLGQAANWTKSCSFMSNSQRRRT